ncbi:MAG TPA: VIT1/CCC1 transporter family protein [Stellaceae bacterium]|nr:VIT1/CCC1 transporter family protein [Stellaceae bacterium]
MADDAGSAARYRGNLQGEVDSAALYRALAGAEQDPHLAEVYRRLASVEEAHAEFWTRQLNRIGASIKLDRPDWRTRALIWLARRFGPQFVLPTLSTLEQRDIGHYDDQPEAVAGGLPAAERSHERVVEAMAAAMPAGATGSALARLEGRHRSGGNALRAAVLGANDGLVSNLSLVMGVAGAEVAGGTILLTGLAGLVAGACSMAMGEWLSVTSSRELAQRQIAVEADELQRMPEEELEEMVLIYQAKGLDEAAARTLAHRLMANKESALDTLTREELGINPEELGGSPWAAAGASFGLFATGAIFPVFPYFFLGGNVALGASLAASGVALVLIGAGTSLFTGRNILFSSARQLLIGYAAAAVTYGIGRLVGVTIGG